MALHLNIVNCHCWAPGAEGPEAWSAWLEDGVLPHGEDPPELKHIKPMQRRRLSLLARSVFKVGAQALEDVPADQQSNTIGVFANAYGQCQATAKMLQTVAAGQPTSPTAFSLSVHNAIAGQFSIAHQMTGGSTSIAPGRDGLGGVLIEAAGWLLDNHNQHVLLCCFEEPIPTALKPYDGNPPTPMAAAFVLQASSRPSEQQPDRPQAQSSPAIQLTMNRTVDNVDLYGAPFWQQVLQFVVFLSRCASDDAAQLRISSGGIQYKWQNYLRNDAQNTPHGASN